VKNGNCDFCQDGGNDCCFFEGTITALHKIIVALRWKYLTQREEKAFEKGPWLVESLLQSHVEVIIQLFIFRNVIAYFIEEKEINEPSTSEGSPHNTDTVELDWHPDLKRKAL